MMPSTRLKVPKAHQDCAKQRFARPLDVCLARVAPKDGQTNDDKDIGCGVKQAIPERINLEVVQGVWRVAATRQHVVPLEHLVKDDAVEKPAQA